MAEPVERTPGDPRGSIPFYRALLSVVLLLILASSALAYLWTMRNLFPGVAILRVPTAEEQPGAPVRDGERRRLLVVQTTSNISCAERQRFDLWAQAVHWQGLGEAMGLAVEIGGENRIPTRPGAIDAIVVPWILCLSESERSRIEGFSRAGGGVVSSGAHGLGEGAPAPFRAAAHFVVPAGRTAPGAALAPGRRLELPKNAQVYTSSTGTPVLWWSQWRLQPAPKSAATWKPAATLSTEDGARSVWFGFPSTHAADGSEAELDRVRSLALLWAAGDDVVSLAPWPKAKRFAWVTALDVQGDEEEVTASLAGSEELGLRSTVFVYADVDGLEPSGKRALRKAAELGSRGDRRTRFQGGTRIHQRQKLTESRARISALSPQPVTGLRVPKEQFDDLTLHESVQAGYAYVLGDPGFDRSYPRWVSAEGRRIALISRAGAGDDHSYTRDQDVGGFLRDMQHVRELGGLYVMALGAERLATAEERGALMPAVARARASDVWMGTSGEVVAWVSAREAIELKTAGAGRLTVTNHGGEALAELTLESFGDRGLPRRLALAKLAAGASATVQIEAASIAVAPRGPSPRRTAGRDD